MSEQDRRRFLQDAAGAALWLAAAHGTAHAMPDSKAALPCRVIDANTETPTSARVRLTDAFGRDVVPLGHPAGLAEEAHEGDVRFQSKRFAYVDGEFAIDSRSIPLQYQVIKGHEFVIAQGLIDSDDLNRGEKTIAISRWSSLAERGWYGGDIHIHHISPRSCRLEMDAEDLHVANILTSDFTDDQSAFEGGVNSLSSGRRLIYVNQEFRNNHLGHLCLLNLKRLVEPVKPMQPYDYPLHVHACDEAHAQGGYVSWAHFPSWPGVESPLDVAMDKLDGLEILCVLDPRALPVFMKQVVPDMESNHGLHLWYRYLNCGFRLTATAGTDKMTNFVTVGANRVFAHVDGDFTYQNWIRALKQGRTFVTNSPVLSFTAGGAEPGAILSLDSTRRKVVEVSATAESQLPYNHLEIVANGVPVAQATPGGTRNRAEIHLEYQVKQSGWLAARVTEDLDEYRRRGVDFQEIHVLNGTRVSDYYGTRRPETVFAHSSPVYVIRDGQPIRSHDDAEYFIRYMDSAIRWLKTDAKFARPADKQASIAAFQRGNAFYTRRAQSRALKYRK